MSVKENSFFKEINGNFGFGCMRLPMDGENVDYTVFEKMIRAFLDAGFNYFDTAHGYLNGKSEIAIRECLSKKIPRDKFLLTNKLTDMYFKTESDIRPFFNSQLVSCGVDYFDFYLMHAQDRKNYEKFKKCNAYEECYKLKEEGKIRHFGISFHDKSDVLDTILSEHPEVEAVQIQLNYLDYEDASVESGKVYEVCEKHYKPVIVMEPVKGGSLVKLPEVADRILRDLNGGSNASYALRFAGGFKNIAMVLSGMSSLEDMNDNLTTMKDFKPLDKVECNALSAVCNEFKKLNLIPCTACRYCIEENDCPKKILIPDLFAAMNALEAFHSWNSEFYYRKSADGFLHGKAGDCIKCGKCERVCPQHLSIRSLLEKVSQAFDKQ